MSRKPVVRQGGVAPDSRSIVTSRLAKALVLAGAAAVVGLLWWATPSQALPNYGAKTGQTCGGCHVSPGGGGELTPKGQAFAAIPTHTADAAAAWAQVSAPAAPPAAAPAAPAAAAAVAPAPAVPASAPTSAALEFTAATSKELGAAVVLTASLKDAKGSPIDKGPVRFFLDTEFGGAKGKMEIGTARTDATGVAAITYRPRIAGKERLVARFEGLGSYAASEQSVALDVADPEPAYKVAPRGLETLSDWIPLAFASVMLVVWSFLGYVLYQIYRIRRAS